MSKEADQKSQAIGCLVVLVLFVVGYFYISQKLDGLKSNAKSMPTKTAEVTNADKAQVKREADIFERDFAKAVSDGLFYSVNYNYSTEIRIDPDHWQMIDYKTKKNLMIKGIVISKHKHGVPACRILSSRSDEVLAETGFLGDIKILK